MKCKTCKTSNRNKCADCKKEICIHLGVSWGGGWSDKNSVHLCRGCRNKRLKLAGWKI